MGVVTITEKMITLPTYEVGKADKNPMFLEKRVYQASKGNVYPYPFTENVEDIKKDKEYKAVIIENEYISVTMLPELGGRIQYGYDKVHDYDFFYRNQVIKPALVGLVGPWISGGVEFNWPQHHRPSTYCPVEYHIESNNDGSKTLWMSEIEMMSRMVGKVGITLYPDKAYVEVTGSSYNNTNVPQNFLWWANIAVHVHDQYESFFPQDVKFVADHGKREISAFPYADRVYYNVDYPSLEKENRNITNYKNIPVPMSYMAMGSDYDFFGGYDYKVNKGTMYISNHHTAPGKKQWTWGSGDFGVAWDRQLTDEDGPYAELMAGAYTDNQPDFTWINPFEKKEFKQYWYPFKDLGKAKNANLDVVVNIDYKDGKVMYKIGTPSKLTECKYEVYQGSTVLKSNVFNLSFDDPIIFDVFECDLKGIDGLGIRVLSKKGDKIIDFAFGENDNSLKAKPAIKAPKPHEVNNCDELYLIGTHLEQYRHATVYPDKYYLEALSRNPNDIRCNTAYGMLLFKRHDYMDSLNYFNRAIDQATKYNPNPKDCEAYYGKGLALFMQRKFKEAYNAFYKSIWDYTYRSSGYLKLAQIDCINKDYQKALEHINLSLVTNSDNTKAHNLKVIILRNLKLFDELKQTNNDIISRNPFSYLSVYEQSKIYGTNQLHDLLQLNEKSYIEVAIEYLEAGEYVVASDLLIELSKKTNVSPMTYYFIGFAFKQMNDLENANRYYYLGNQADPDYCFPHRIEEKVVLLDVIETTKSGQACYLLGNLLYDKLNYEEAINYFEQALEMSYNYSVLYRNLGVAYYNNTKNVEQAIRMYEMALQLNQNDGRVLYELDQLYKIENKSVEARLSFLLDKVDIVQTRDDLYIEFVTLHNLLEKHEEALKLLLNRKFHPFEGGEGKVSDQYKFTVIELGKKALDGKAYKKAIEYFNMAKNFPQNLGEGKIYGTPEADVNYFLGVANKALGNVKKAESFFKLSAEEEVVSSSNLSYKPEKLQMNYYQALSLMELREEDKANQILEDLVAYAFKKSKIEAEVDYFAISVPEFLIFETDLNLVNRTHCYYLMGLGYYGLKKYNKSEEYLKKALTINVNNYEANAFYKKLFSK
jgi:tetratricopeptide (TPR) repeat protein